MPFSLCGGQGSEFESRLIKETYRHLPIETERTSAAQSASVVE